MENIPNDQERLIRKGEGGEDEELKLIQEERLISVRLTSLINSLRQQLSKLSHLRDSTDYERVQHLRKELADLLAQKTRNDNKPTLRSRAKKGLR